MSDEQAIKILKDMIEYEWGFIDDEHPSCIYACQKAIEALEQRINIAKFNQEAYENGKKDGYIQGKTEKGNEWDCLPDNCTGRVKLKEFYKDGKLIGVANCMGCEYFHFAFGNCYNMYGYACSRDTCKFEDMIKDALMKME